MKFSKSKLFHGISLLEILVAVTVFAILGILITRSVLLTLGGSRKSESVIKIRENLNYSIGVIERQLRNANSVTDCSNSDTSQITYVDQNGNTSGFYCGMDEIGYIASGSARISSNAVNITECSFTCQIGVGSPSSVTINLEATDASASGTENSVVSATTQVFLRNY